LSNKLDHGVEKFQMGVEEAELVLNAFLSLLKWLYCESGLTAKLPSIYALAATDGQANSDDVKFTLHIEGKDINSFTESDREQLLSAIKILLAARQRPTVVSLRYGSVFLTIRLRREEADRLLKAIEAGALREYGVIGGEIKEPKAPSSSKPAPAPAPLVGPISSSIKKSAHVVPPLRAGNGSSVSRWISLAKKGNEAAMEKLWERYSSALLDVVRTRLRGNKQTLVDEEDIAQSVFRSFLRLTQKGEVIAQNRYELRNYLVHTAVRKAYDVTRKERVAKSSRELKTNRGRSLSQAFSNDPEPEEVAIMHEHVDRLLGKLGDSELRKIATLKLEGYTNNEIAAMMGRAVSTVERKLARIRALWEKDEE
jgi:RNA polymerase sigma factor (sigma-70 family)